MTARFLISATALLAAAPLAAQQANRSSPPPGPGFVVETNQRVPTNAAESSLTAISVIARQVAEVRSGLDLMRRASYNDPDGVVGERADMVRTRCLSMATAATDNQRMVCRGCQTPRIQPALDAYRAYLPALAQLGRSCAARLERARAGTQPAGAQRLRQDVRAIQTDMVAGLRQYEAALTRVRTAFGWTR